MPDENSFNILCGSKRVEAAAVMTGVAFDFVSISSADRSGLKHSNGDQPMPDENSFNILCGSKRVEAYANLGFSILPCAVSISSADRSGLKPPPLAGAGRGRGVSISSADRSGLKPFQSVDADRPPCVSISSADRSGLKLKNAHRLKHVGLIVSISSADRSGLKPIVASISAAGYMFQYPLRIEAG